MESPVGGWSLSFITIVMEEFHILLGVLEVESQICNSTDSSRSIWSICEMVTFSL